MDKPIAEDCVGQLIERLSAAEAELAASQARVKELESERDEANRQLQLAHVDAIQESAECGQLSVELAASQARVKELEAEVERLSEGSDDNGR